MPRPGCIHMTLTQKLIISFAVCGVCMTTALVYAIFGLGVMHRMESDIARNDVAAATITVTLRDVMLAQERYLGKYQILHQSEFQGLYERNAEEFRNRLASLEQVYHGDGIGQLRSAYDAYARLCRQVFAGTDVGPSAMGPAAGRVEAILDLIRAEQKVSLAAKLKISDDKEAETVNTSIALASLGGVVSFLVAFYLIYSFASSIGKLQKATHRIAAGDFDHDPLIPPGDEIGSLAEDFMNMAQRLKDLEQISLDASPLTRLPGNIAIERSINRRLRDQLSFAMCYLDLDNFKSYNDRYGYIKASELIKEASQVIYDAVKRLNDPDVFVGHIGGDDFVVIISADLAAMACQSIIHDIDAMVPAYYSELDRCAGAIEGIDRYGVPRTFPLISISIAALICEPGDYATAAEIATAAAEIKDQVKESSGSNYIVVREARVCEE